MNAKPNEPHDLAKVSRRTLTVVAVVIAGTMAGLFLLGLGLRHARIATRESMAREIRDQPPVVLVVHPSATQQSFELTLPADVRAYAATALYARTNGYLASWTTDIGARVRQGDLLATLSAPDTDAQLEQAEAAQRQMAATSELSAATDARYRGLIDTQGVTQEQLDQFDSARQQAAANLAAATATVDRLKALVAFERITAPFDGVVTARNYDTGALISATNTAPGQELFDVADEDRLRVFVNVPQADALLVKVDQPVALVLERNFPGHRFTGVVKRSAGALDPVTRTLRTELDFRNDDPAGRILPGMYGEAVFTLHRDRPVLTIPTSALLFETEGKEVAIVGPGNRIHFQKVVLGTDFGTEIEVSSGLDADAEVVANPGEELAEGIVVSPR